MKHFPVRLVTVTASAFLLLILSACSNQKNTFVRRNYHNLTAHYNVYFNGKEAYKQGIKTIEENHKENFSKLLPVFLYDDEELLGSVSGDMDRAVEKGNKLITKHSITAKPKKRANMSQAQKEFYAKKEFCNWVDDAYMLMGKAYFYKRDFLTAQRNFGYLLSTYKGKPESYPAKLWVVASKIQSDYKEDAVELLKKYDDDEEFPVKLNGKKEALWADVLIKQEKYTDAINHLEDAVKLQRRKKKRIRWMYLLAQLYKQEGDDERAYNLFAEVSKMNTNYEMEFNAKINLATSFPAKAGNSAEIEKLLRKLMRDSKNVDYLDQIYYALAEIERGKGNIDNAIDLYQKSVQASVSNDQQKAVSYLSVADIYYERKDYINAQPYYDSCVTFLTKDFDNYDQIQVKSKHLNELARNYKTVAFEDSVQKIAKMDKRQIDLLISDLIQKVREEEELERQRAAQEMQESAQFREEFGYNNRNSSNWYFYNTQLVARGKQEFAKKWNGRPNKDNWRRANKSTNDWDSFASEDNLDEEGEKEQKFDNKNPQYYLQNIPLSDSAMEASHASIRASLYDIGMIFNEYIGEVDQAIWAYEEIVRRYPGHEILPAVYYNLYRICIDNGKEEMAEKYRMAIINEFPDTKYAQAMSDPNFFRDIRAGKLKVERKYKRAYMYYLNEDFASALNVCNEADTLFKTNHLVEQFAFIKAMSVGKIAGVSVMKSQLEQFKDSAKNEELIAVAEEIIKQIIDQKLTDEIIKTAKDSLQISEAVAKEVAALQEEEKEIYFLDAETKHYLLMIGNAETVDPQRLRFNLLNYNLEYFSNFEFHIKIHQLTDKINLITVGPLKNNKQAQSYYDLIGINPQIFDRIEKDDVEYMLISDKNLETLKADKRIEKYQMFYYDWYSQL